MLDWQFPDPHYGVLCNILCLTPKSNVVATLNQRQWRCFNVATTSCAKWDRRCLENICHRTWGSDQSVLDPLYARMSSPGLPKWRHSAVQGKSHVVLKVQWTITFGWVIEYWFVLCRLKQYRDGRNPEVGAHCAVLFIYGATSRVIY